MYLVDIIYIKQSYNTLTTHLEPPQSIISHELKELDEDTKKKLM